VTEQIGGTNDEEKALQTCISMFQNCGREGSRLIIHVTSGKLKGNWQATSALLITTSFVSFIH
jgi:hypothetical protein